MYTDSAVEQSSADDGSLYNPSVPHSPSPAMGEFLEVASIPEASQQVQIVPFQLYDDLGPQYPTTNLILHLIKFISANVCSFKCNAFTAYLLLSDAAVICRNINRLIQTLDDSPDDIDLWDDFKKFTVAITPLEKCVCGHRGRLRLQYTYNNMHVQVAFQTR